MDVESDIDAPVRAVEAALEELRRGRFVLVRDDEDREDEGDLIIPAQYATAAQLAFMVRHTSGLICVGMTGRRLDRLRLDPMVAHGDDPRGTAFTVSVDLQEGTTTGISAEERARTIRALADPDRSADAFSRPGHVFPLRAHPDGVLARAGHTEAAVDLCRLAGLRPAGALAEVTNDDGTMARREQLVRFAEQHRIPLIAVSDVIRYRQRRDVLVRRGPAGRIPTESGDFSAIAYSYVLDGTDHLAVVRGDVSGAENVLVRVHSECLTGDVLGSRRCDCGPQLSKALSNIGAVGHGVVIYLRGHEGRGIGLSRKLRAYGLQDRGLDTVDANLAQGLPADTRDYAVAAQILRDLDVRSVRLMTNNPAKKHGLRMHGVPVVDRVPMVVPPTEDNIDYLRTKQERLHHRLGLRVEEVPRALAPKPPTNRKD
ncbi:bifunctional 3,4-dihydroxy-2-butanone-4-phosphate synthase/GTP cyclohydrolase II [Saccharopolyspora sp. NPDC050389]|uniref:bifunctional 3,4-dihydroxy-2-butanone-4-phosphate synthase/GTP cyclohydrolase II n=1 Tax=Saccharopolyspora sp. NPDC050389 TaxID=3155516 RepID=UPI0034025555